MNYISIVQDIIFWIEQNIDKPLSIEDVAEKSGYSKWHLQRMFKSVTGQILGSYIRSRRLTYVAMALRLTNRSILEIAIQYQFDSQQTVTRAFKKQFNQTPATYRKLPNWNLSGITPCIMLNERFNFHGEITSLTHKVLKGIAHNFNCKVGEITQNKHHYYQKFWINYIKQHKNKHPLPTELYGVFDIVRSNAGFDEKHIHYITALEENFIDQSKHNGEKLTEILIEKGDYLCFEFVDHYQKYDRFIKYIYTQLLPEQKITRRAGYDIEVFYPKSERVYDKLADAIHVKYFIPIMLMPNAQLSC